MVKKKNKKISKILEKKNWQTNVIEKGKYLLKRY